YFGQHVTGYAYAWWNTPALQLTNRNKHTYPEPIPTGGPVPYHAPPSSSDRPMAACITMSRPGENVPAQRNNYTYQGITGGLFWPAGVLFQHRTSHMDKGRPAGGNIGMMDNHVEWRKFGAM